MTTGGAAVFAAVIYFSGLDKISALRGTDVRFVVLACLAGLAVTLTSALRWRLITDSLMGQRTFTFPQFYVSLLISRVFGLFLPRGSAEVGVRFAALTGIAKTGPEKAAASVVLDRLFDLPILLAWLAPVLLILSGAVPEKAGAVLLPVATVVAVLGMLRLSLLVGWTARVLSRILACLGGPRVVRDFAQARARNLRQLGEVEQPSSGQTLFLSGLTVLRYVLNATMFYLIASSLGLGISFYTYLLAGPIIQLSVLVAFTPGGLGIVEAGWVAVYALAGVPGDDVTVFVVGQRAFQYIFFTTLAGISYLVLWLPRRRNLEQLLATETTSGREGRA